MCRCARWTLVCVTWKSAEGDSFPIGLPVTLCSIHWAERRHLLCAGNVLIQTLWLLIHPQSSPTPLLHTSEDSNWPSCYGELQCTAHSDTFFSLMFHYNISTTFLENLICYFFLPQIDKILFVITLLHLSRSSTSRWKKKVSCHALNHVSFSQIPEKQDSTGHLSFFFLSPWPEGCIWELVEKKNKRKKQAKSKGSVRRWQKISRQIASQRWSVRRRQSEKGGVWNKQGAGVRLRGVVRGEVGG